MLIDFETLINKYDIHSKEVLHIGAHLGEEAEEYHRAKVPMVWWVEGNPEVLPQLEENLTKYVNQYVIHALVTDKDDDERLFNITNYDGMSSSVFDFDKHPNYSPDTVFVDRKVLPTRTIDSLCKENSLTPDLLCLDIQGAELLALHGATNTLPGVRWIYTEVSTDSVYAGGAQMHEIDEFLSPHFERVETDLGMHGGTHGDAFYVRVN